MNTQQFFKGLAMALITVLVTFFTSTPIDFMLLAVTAVCTVLTYFGKNLIPWLHSDSPPASLSLINIASGVLIALGAALTESVATYLVEGQILWTVVWKVTAYTAGTYLVSTFFAPPYSAEKKRFVATKKYIAMKGYQKKMAVLLILIVGLPIMASAQKVSIFGHVSQKSVDRGIFNNGEFVFSLDAVVAGPTWTFESGFDKPILIQGAAIAIGYKHLKPNLKSDWGVSIALSNKFKMGDEQTQQVGIALLPNYYNLVIGPVWFIGNKYPGIMTGGSITF